MPLKVVVCGAGPVGCAAALRIARMPKTEVTLMEKRSLTELVELSASKRAYCMAIRPRGKQALDALDITLPSTQHPMQGVTMLPSGQELPVWSKDQYLVARNTFASELVQVAAEERGLKLALGTAVVDVDFDARTLQLRSAHSDVATVDESERAAASFAAAASGDGAASNSGAVSSHARTAGQGAAGLVADSEVGVNAAAAATSQGPPKQYEANVSYDLLIAADGAFSQVRKCAIEAGHIRELGSWYSDVKYKTFPQIVIPEDTPDLPKFLSPDIAPFTRMIFGRATEASDCDWHIIMWRPSARLISGNITRVTPDRPITEETLEEAFPGMFPAWMRAQMAERTAKQPLFGFGGTIFSSQLHAGTGVAFVGDSGHPMSITQGHGCNTGLESAKVFCDLLERSLTWGDPKLDEVTALYSRTRLPQVHAVQRIERSAALRSGHYEARTLIEKWDARLTNWALDRAADLKKRLGERGEWLRTREDLSTVGCAQTDVWAPVQAVQMVAMGAAVVMVALVIEGARRAWA